MSGTDVIFRPVFKGTSYQYHICSECNAELKFTQISWGGISFYGCEKIRYCPNCGKPIIRFSQKPIFEQEIDWSPLEAFIKLRIDYENKVEWLFWCKLSPNERDVINMITEFSESASGYDRIVIDNIKVAARFKPSWQSMRKLEQRFETSK